MTMDIFLCISLLGLAHFNDVQGLTDCYTCSSYEFKSENPFVNSTGNEFRDFDCETGVNIVNTTRCQGQCAAVDFSYRFESMIGTEFVSFDVEGVTRGCEEDLEIQELGLDTNNECVALEDFQEQLHVNSNGTINNAEGYVCTCDEQLCEIPSEATSGFVDCYTCSSYEFKSGNLSANSTGNEYRDFDCENGVNLVNTTRCKGQCATVNVSYRFEGVIGTNFETFDAQVVGRGCEEDLNPNVGLEKITDCIDLEDYQDELHNNYNGTVINVKGYYCSCDEKLCLPIDNDTSDPPASDALIVTTSMLVLLAMDISFAFLDIF